jgi:hypothetical protein
MNLMPPMLAITNMAMMPIDALAVGAVLIEP